jgi:tetratricopeptide (TPR) repeat protein
LNFESPAFGGAFFCLTMSDRIEMLKKWMVESPNDSFPHYGLALEYAALEDFGAALDLLRELAGKSPDYLPLYYQAGRMAELLEQPHMAREFYERGVEVAKAQGDRKTEGELRTALDFLED